MQKLSFLLAAALALALSAPTLADTHLGNGGVTGSYGGGAVHDPDREPNGGGGTVGGGTSLGGNGHTYLQPAASCPEEPDGVHDPRRGKPLCGQPPTPPCNAPPGAACTLLAPAPKTYPNCAALIVANAALLHFGRCENQPAPEPQRLSIGFEMKNMRQCIAKVSHAKRLKPKVAPWLQADGKPMRTREFCKRLFGDGTTGGWGVADPIVNQEADDAADDEDQPGDDD